MLREAAMSMLDELNNPAVWEEFLQYKLQRKHLSQRKQEEWECFVQEERYRAVTEQLAQPDYVFNPPEKISVNKSGTGKKRIVYAYGEVESMALKVMSYLLYRYEGKISPRCYSFRRNSSAKEAIAQILRIKNPERKFCLKVDISNYFNSIPVDRLTEVLREVIDDDQRLAEFLERLLTDGRAVENGEIIHEERGAMAGIPIAPFLANIYLLSMDNDFEKRKIDYFRYSDDILIFADSREELSEYENLLLKHITDKGLKINPEKVSVSGPGEEWQFLGFCYKNGVMDLSEVTVNKMKAKIRRKAHALYRRRVRRGQDFTYAAKALVKTFNKKYFDEAEENRFTWSRWFFPVITTDKGLRELDEYLVKYVRYLYKGRHYKGNYRVTYEEIKQFGFRSLVHEYYKWKEDSFSKGLN